jgi:hypothetical protein
MAHAISAAFVIQMAACSVGKPLASCVAVSCASKSLVPFK